MEQVKRDLTFNMSVQHFVLRCVCLHIRLSVCFTITAHAFTDSNKISINVPGTKENEIYVRIFQFPPDSKWRSFVGLSRRCGRRAAWSAVHRTTLLLVLHK